jgi:hypothetical protein
MEKLIYEAKPYALSAIALLLLRNSSGADTLLRSSCVLLLATAIIIIYSRLRARGVIS